MTRPKLAPIHPGEILLKDFLEKEVIVLAKAS